MRYSVLRTDVPPAPRAMLPPVFRSEHARDMHVISRSTANSQWCFFFFSTKTRDSSFQRHELITTRQPNTLRRRNSCLIYSERPPKASMPRLVSRDYASWAHGT